MDGNSTPSKSKQTESNGVSVAVLDATLVGKRVRMWWGGDDAWYTGEVIAFDADIGGHTVKYDDGEEETYAMNNEKVSATGRTWWQQTCLATTQSPQQKKPGLLQMRRSKRHFHILVSTNFQFSCVQMEVIDESGTVLAVYPPQAGSSSIAASSGGAQASASNPSSTASSAAHASPTPSALAAKRPSPKKAARSTPAKQQASKPTPAVAGGASDDSDDSDEDIPATVVSKRALRSKAAAKSRAKPVKGGNDSDSSAGSDAMFDKESDESDFSAASADDSDDDDHSLGSAVVDADEAAAEDAALAAAAAAVDAAAADSDDSDAVDVGPSKKRSAATPGSKRKRNTTAMDSPAPMSPPPTPVSGGGSAAGATSSHAAASGAKQTLQVGGASWHCPAGKSGAATARRFASMSDEDKKSKVFGAGEHYHDTLPWLWEGRRDAQGRKPEHPDFNPRTLDVPATFWDPPKGSSGKKPTPAQAQWWEFKKDNMDTLLFFKMGKFYELFHMDADVLVAELDCIYMRGFSAHAGFPETAFGRFSEALVARGYRIARIEQTETPDQLAERKKKITSGKKPQVVMREMCSIKSRGTRMEGHMDFVGGSTPTAGEDTTAGATTSRAVRQAQARNTETWLIALKETPLEPEAGADEGGVHPEVRIGFAAAECATGEVHLAEFDDDKLRSRLRTALVRFPAAEFVYCSGAVSADTLKFARHDAPTATATPLHPKDEFPTALGAAKMLWSGQYFDPSDLATGASASSSGNATSDEDFAAGERVPASLVQALSRAKGQDWKDVGPLRADTPASLAVSALGGMLFHLKRCQVDRAVLGQGQIFTYVPIAAAGRATGATDAGSAKAARPAASAASGAGEGGSAAAAPPMPGLEAVPGLDFAALRTAAGEAERLAAEWAGAPKVTLDAATLVNLEILANNADGSTRGSLLGAVDRTVSPGGRRLLREWVTKPLAAPGDVLYRAAAVQALMQLPGSVVGQVRRSLGDMPDIAKVCARIRRNGSRALASDHPDARAVLYEGPTYAKRKLKDLQTMLKAMDLAQDIKDALSLHGSTIKGSHLLARVANTALPAVGPLVTHFRTVCDVDTAAASGEVKPKPGMDADYDAALAGVKSVEAEFGELLQEYKSDMKCSSLCWYHQANGARRYQLEVPDAVAERLSGSFEVMSARKSGKVPVRRYYTPKIKALISRLEAAEAVLADAQADSMRRVFARFDAARPVWSATAAALSHLDGLLSLAQWNVEGDGGATMAPPVFVRRIPDAAEAVAAAQAQAAAAEAVQPSSAAPWDFEAALPVSTTPVLQLTQGRHPCVVRSATAGDKEFVANDVTLGGDSTPATGGGVAQGDAAAVPTCVLLTGPNMGGKSTLLRQTCMAAIVAHLGAYVPAEALKLTPVDRVFTRVGASDRILAGQSTFFVELAETATILSGATADSLVILDELGRGTATFDGNAIAYAVVQHLTQVLSARTMFATHYHALCDEFEGDPRVAMTHMACYVEDRPDGTADVTFLYQHQAGACPKSYGMNVARLARLPDSVIRRAAAKSEQFEIALHSAIHAHAGSSGAGKHWAALPREARLDTAKSNDVYQQAAALLSGVAPPDTDAEGDVSLEGGVASKQQGPDAALASLAQVPDDQLVAIWKQCAEIAAAVPE